MNKINICIWEREFELNVIFQNYQGEEVTSNQDEVYNSINSIDFSEAQRGVEEYIMRKNAADLNEHEITNIFKYVNPKSIIIPRDENVPVFAVMCNYKFDIEHGIAVVFENERFKTVCSQDMIL